jgi:EAL domain-containing protein (putative c-di-GMP-specific phosphodiesterase class I)
MAVVVALTAIARHLGIPAVAVGVESWQQLEKLRELGCTHAQGHLFARPVPADRCPVYLTTEAIDFVLRSEENATNEVTGVNPTLLFGEF